MILYGHDKHGGFVVGDSDSGITSYSYPTSGHAEFARKNAELVARSLIAEEIVFRHIVMSRRDLAEHIASYDTRNWDLLTMVLL